MDQTFHSENALINGGIFELRDSYLLSKLLGSNSDAYYTDVLLGTA